MFECLCFLLLLIFVLVGWLLEKLGLIGYRAEYRRKERGEEIHAKKWKASIKPETEEERQNRLRQLALKLEENRKQDEKDHEEWLEKKDRQAALIRAAEKQGKDVCWACGSIEPDRCDEGHCLGCVGRCSYCNSCCKCSGCDGMGYCAYGYN